jgi:hypothetical protein
LFDHKTYILTIGTNVIDMEKDDANTIIMAGGTFYFIGCVGSFTNWKTHQIIDTASAVTSGLGLLTTFIGILLINSYLLFKAFALIGIALILAFGVAWIAHLHAL